MRPAVAIVGGPPLAHTNGLFNALAVNALNALLGSVEQPGGVFFTPQLERWRRRPRPPGRAGVRRPRSLERLAAAILAGDAAPAGAAARRREPGLHRAAAWKVREAFEKVPFIVSFGSFLDETSVLADLILPDHSFLESWAEAVPESGSLDGAWPAWRRR